MLEIKSIVYKKEQSLYTILAFKTADGNKPLIPEHYQTLKEFIFEIVSRNALHLKTLRRGRITVFIVKIEKLTFIQFYKFAKLIKVDCGAGWSGRLCLYNIDTDKYFLSDFARKLNPNEEGR